VIEKIKSITKNAYLNTIYLWIVFLVISFIWSESIFSAVTIFYTGIMPFVLVVIWLSISETGTSIRSMVKKWHVAIFISWAVFAYAVYAQKWASAYINDIFYVDAGNLGITYTVLAVLFTPFGVFYQPSFISSLQSGLLVLGMFTAPFIVLLLILPISFKEVVSLIFKACFGIFLSAFLLSAIFNLSNNMTNMTRSFALWADFNSKHMCSDNVWVKEAESVLFLGGDRVLVYTPSKPEGERFSSKTCNFSKSF